MNRSYYSIPNYLRRYVVEQDYSSYTPQDHATWRYIMRRARKFFGEHAVPVYQTGLERTGITIDRIPRINDIDQKLKDFGWGAIGVCGFIPPAAFLEFQAQSIMPIAMDMRSIDHIAYTPAPDIVHEAAGHVPIIVDDGYRRYLTRYAAMASKAIISREDIALYEAIRILSDIKENPDTVPKDIAKAEAGLNAAYSAMTYVSELAQLGRIAWWTAEYGLVGDIKNPKIYGAGLLSSVGESEKCLSAEVRKIPLTIDCVNQGYDITEPQPQLFVAESFETLPNILDDFEKTMAFHIGGIAGLKKALQADSVNTVLLDSGVSVSGEVTDFEVSANQELSFLKFTGPVQLAWDEIEIPGQGRARHGGGFSSPLGRWKEYPDRNPETLSDIELQRIGLARGRPCKLEFTSGFRVEGVLWHIYRNRDKIMYMTWNQVKVTKGDKLYYDPAWGEFDMILGLRAVSVHGGPADRDTFGDYEFGNVGTVPGRTSAYSDREWGVFDLYSRVRALREAKPAPADLVATLSHIAKKFTDEHAQEWLLGIEILELATQRAKDQDSLVGAVDRAVRRVAACESSHDKHSVPKELIEHGLAQLDVV